VKIVGAAVAGIVLASSFGAASPPPEPAAVRSAAAHQTDRFFDARTFANARARVATVPVTAAPRIRGMIVPHHWLAADLIAGAFRNLAAGGPVRRVILIGPNHIGAGGAAYITSGLPWRTPYGAVSADIEGIRRIAEVKPRVLDGEHSIAGLVPVVAWSFPGATIVPVAVRAFPRPAEFQAMRDALAALMRDPATVLIASVDFSHYRSVPEAGRRNAETVAALSALDTDRVMGWSNEHMDSPASIALLMETMRAIGATGFELWADTSSASFGGRSTAPDVTSYVTASYVLTP
jgi:AmmeMemoRadiSam system protein B